MSFLDYLPGYASSRDEFNRRVADTLMGNLHEFATKAPVIGPIGTAIENPTLGTVTNAGVQSLLAAGRPIQALKGLGVGYGAAAAGDLGLIDALMSASAEAKKFKSATPDVARLPGLSDEENASYQGIMGRLSAGDFTGAERRALEAQAKIFTDKSGVSAQRDAELAAAKAAADKAEFDRQVGVAEKARDDGRARDRRFSSTKVGQMWEATGGVGPFLVSGMLGAATRGASGGGSTFKNYGLPALIGGTTGAASTNLPLAYNAFMTEPDNPESVAANAYARELPDTHPKKQQAAAYAASVPLGNPVRESASKELYDPYKAGERMLFGALEGIGGGLFGADLMRMPGRLLEGMAAMPGRMATAAQTSRPLSPPSPIGGAGGNAQPPVAAFPPAVPQQALPIPPQPLVPGAQGSRPAGYGKAQQGVARPLIDSDVAVGGSVPSANALENAYQAAGVKIPTTQKYTKNLNDTQKLVSEMQAQGMSGPEIVKALQSLRNQGAGILGLTGAAVLGGSQVDPSALAAALKGE